MQSADKRRHWRPHRRTNKYAALKLVADKNGGPFVPPYTVVRKGINKYYLFFVPNFFKSLYLCGSSVPTKLSAFVGIVGTHHCRT